MAKNGVEYKLFAVPFSLDAVAEVEQKEAFYKICPEYILVYSKRGFDLDGAEAVSEDEAERLSDSDRRWLLDSQLSVLSAEMGAFGVDGDRIDKVLNAAIADFERRLAKERLAMLKGGVDDGTEEE